MGKLGESWVNQRGNYQRVRGMSTDDVRGERVRREGEGSGNGVLRCGYAAGEGGGGRGDGREEGRSQ